MKIITEFSSLSSLDLPTSIKQQLEQHLTAPFNGDIRATNSYWQDVSTTLILIEAGDTDI